MLKKELQESLAKLHGELSDQEQLDDSTRQLLKKFADDINRLLDDDDESAADEIDPPSEQVQDLVLKFEADHPQLTAALNQVASALANMGSSGRGVVRLKRVSRVATYPHPLGAESKTVILRSAEGSPWPRYLASRRRFLGRPRNDS
jgi:hypothetical protein